MKKLSLVILTSLLTNIALADHHESHNHLDAHVHGTIKVEMAVEGKTIDIDIDGPAESFIGFEYTPKTAKEKKALSDAEALWTKDLISKLFILDKSLGCKIVTADFKQEIEDKKSATVHSDIEAEGKITCAKELKGQTLIVGLKKHFSQIKKLAVDLVGSETKTIDITSDSQTIKL